MSVMVVISLFGVMLLTMLTRVILPLGQKPEGMPIKQVSLPFRQRLLYHRTSIYLIGTAMVLGGVGGWLSFAFQVIIVMAVFAIVGVKIHYNFTSEGVALNNVVFRHWSEFEEVAGDHRQLRLNAKEQMRPFKILLPPAEAEEIGKLATKLVKNGGRLENLSALKATGTVGRPPKKRKAIS